MATRLGFVRVALVFGLGLWGCADAPTEPDHRSSPQFAVKGGPEHLCQLGCLDVDPNPTAPGVFLGSGVTPETCFVSPSSDVDGDGLSTFCERNLASAFAPELYYSYADNVGREPHWVARLASPDNDNVLIGYLLSYHRDEGSSSYLCSLPPPSYHWSCDGHNGDSEAIFLEVYYDWPSQHWVLHQALYSQHGSYGVYERVDSMGMVTDPYPTQLFYPAHPGSYPRAYVAEGKHANYSSRRACNSGGAFGTDTCVSVNTAARVAAGSWLNIGSRALHSSAQDCMQSSDILFQARGF